MHDVNLSGPMRDEAEAGWYVLCLFWLAIHWRPVEVHELTLASNNKLSEATK